MGKSFLYAGILSFLLVALFLPISLHTELYYQVRGKKAGFCLLLYGKLKVLGGYITTCTGGLAIHLSEKKAILVKYRDMEKQRKNFPFRNLFTLKKVKLCVRTGPEYFLPFYALEVLKNTARRIRPNCGRFFDGEFWLEDGDELRIAAVIVLKFTLYQQLTALLKYLFGRIKETWKTKRLTV